MFAGRVWVRNFCPRRAPGLTRHQRTCFTTNPENPTPLWCEQYMQGNIVWVRDFPSKRHLDFIVCCTWRSVMTRSRPAVLLEKSGNDRLIWSRLSCITPLIRVCSVEVWVRSSSQKTFSLPRDLLLACRRRQTRLGWVHWHWKLRQWININITYICTSFLMNTDTCIFYTLVAALVLAVNAGRGFRKTVPTQAVEGVLCMFGAQSTMGLERKVQSHPISAPMY